MNETTQAAPIMRDILRSATSAAADSDLDRHRAAGARLLEQRRTSLAETEHAYAIGRARIVADAERQLNQFEQDFVERRARLLHEIERLEHMLGGAAW